MANQRGGRKAVTYQKPTTRVLVDAFAMSLWYKPLDQVTFQDVEAFCLHRRKEGIRLDYKR